MRTLLFVILVMFFVLFPSCTESKSNNPISPAPTPLQEIPIPDWVTEAKDIEVWLRSSRANYVSDDFTTGYQDYKFTPAELLMETIPDVNQRGKYITKTPFWGDCDDFAIITAYLMQVKLGYQAYYVVIADGKLAHAISYGKDEKRHYVFDLWLYQGKYTNTNKYLKEKYPSTVVVSVTPIEDVLQDLYDQGHVRYYEVLTP